MRVLIEYGVIRVEVELSGGELDWPTRDELRQVFSQAEAALGYAPEGIEEPHHG